MKFSMVKGAALGHAAGKWLIGDADLVMEGHVRAPAARLPEQKTTVWVT